MSIAEKEPKTGVRLQARMVELMMQSVDALPDLGDLVARPTWQADAACRDYDLNGFFPEGTAISPETRRVCAGCRVLTDCLTFALGKPSLRGVWAGTSERERGRMRAAMRLSAAAR
jgi:WhiB family redox-sensing transcriptional regulator